MQPILNPLLTLPTRKTPQQPNKVTSTTSYPPPICRHFPFAQHEHPHTCLHVLVISTGFLPPRRRQHSLQLTAFTDITFQDYIMDILYTQLLFPPPRVRSSFPSLSISAQPSILRPPQHRCLSFAFTKTYVGLFDIFPTNNTPPKPLRLYAYDVYRSAPASSFEPWRHTT